MDNPTVLIVDSTCMVLQQCHDANYILELYGSLGYPFSDERIQFLQSEDDAIAMQPSLQSLLASPQRDYHSYYWQVPIHTLEDKVVAIYFYEEDGSEVPVSQLAGKNVLVFFNSYGLDTERIEFLKILKGRHSKGHSRYQRGKKTDHHL
ncbi:hypothetical protein AgCh_019369 [Apium graveolens]